MNDMNAKASGTVNSYLSFRIGSEVYAANVKNVLNILEMTKITKVPKAPAYMKGVINLRGTVLPVIDSRIKFGIEESEITSNTCIIVLELHVDSEPIMVGAIVDSVKEVLEITDSEILPPPSIGTNFRSDYLQGMAQSEDSFTMLLDAEKVFASEEIVDLTAITQEANRKVIVEAK
jgi:purine-binding chemotaxis protein CheW